MSTTQAVKTVVFTVSGVGTDYVIVMPLGLGYYKSETERYVTAGLMKGERYMHLQARGVKGKDSISRIMRNLGSRVF